LTQTVTIPAGTTTPSFRLMNPRGGSTLDFIGPRIGSTPVWTCNAGSAPTGIEACAKITVAVSVLADGGKGALYVCGGSGKAGDFGKILVDDVSLAVAAVPVPATGILIGAARTGGVALTRRCRARG
jgi:hypothetical protein